MFFIKLRRVIKAGVINFTRNGVVSLASVLVLVVTLFVIGSLLFAQALLDSAIAQIKDKVDITVYFKTDASEQGIVGVKQFLDTLPDVKAVTYTSRETALAVFKERHKDNSLILGSLEEIGDNPLGASLTIKAKDPSNYAAIADILKGDSVLDASGKSLVNMALIDKVNYFQNKVVIDRLAKILDSTKKVGFAATLILSIIAVLVTFNTIRLAIYTAREEIAVMKLVGASNNYVRGPFMAEGILYGAVAGVLVMLLFFALTTWLGPTTENFFGGLNIYRYYTANLLELFGIMLGTGTALGMVSSYLAIRRYLKV